MDRTVYVITDAQGQRDQTREALAGLLTPTVLTGLVAVPLWAVAALLVGLPLGWHPVILIGAAVIASPVLIHATDLLAARLGLPPLRWIADQAIARRRARRALTTRR